MGRISTLRRDSQGSGAKRSSKPVTRSSHSGRCWPSGKYKPPAQRGDPCRGSRWLHHVAPLGQLGENGTATPTMGDGVAQSAKLWEKHGNHVGKMAFTGEE